MKMGINYAAEVLHRNIRDLIQSSNCPAVVVRSVLEHELAAVQSWEDQEISRERQQFQRELAAEKETKNTQAPADQPDAATEQED